jgi:hypothetical protein
MALIQASLSSMPLYYMSVFKRPSRVARKLEDVMMDFLWSGTGKRKDHLMDWKKTCRLKEEGGFGIGSLQSKNIALIAN